MIQERTKGIDVIDLGMGNPDRPTPQHIVNKLCEVVQDSKTHRYSVLVVFLMLAKQLYTDIKKILMLI